MAVQPTSLGHSPVLVPEHREDTTPTTEGPEPKKRRFHPLRGLKRIFRLKRRSSTGGGGRRSVKSRSTSELVQVDDGGRPLNGHLYSDRLSVSHESIFKSDSPQTRGSLSMGLPRGLHDELCKVILPRRDTSEEEDLGLPRSPYTSPTTAQVLEQGLRNMKGKSNSLSDNSLLSMGSSENDDDGGGASRHDGISSSVPVSDEFGFPSQPTKLLNNAGAHHRISVRPAKTRPSKKSRKQTPVITDALPEVINVQKDPQQSVMDDQTDLSGKRSKSVVEHPKQDGSLTQEDLPSSNLSVEDPRHGIENNTHSLPSVSPRTRVKSASLQRPAGGQVTSQKPSTTKVSRSKSNVDKKMQLNRKFEHEILEYNKRKEKQQKKESQPDEEPPPPDAVKSGCLLFGRRHSESEDSEQEMEEVKTKKQVKKEKKNDSDDSFFRRLTQRMSDRKKKKVDESEATTEVEDGGFGEREELKKLPPRPLPRRTKTTELPGGKPKVGFDREKRPTWTSGGNADIIRRVHQVEEKPIVIAQSHQQSTILPEPRHKEEKDELPERPVSDQVKGWNSRADIAKGMEISEAKKPVAKESLVNVDIPMEILQQDSRSNKREAPTDRTSSPSKVWRQMVQPKEIPLSVDKELSSTSSRDNVLPHNESHQSKRQKNIKKTLEQMERSEQRREETSTSVSVRNEDKDDECVVVSPEVLERTQSGRFTPPLGRTVTIPNESSSPDFILQYPPKTKYLDNKPPPKPVRRVNSARREDQDGVRSFGSPSLPPDITLVHRPHPSGNIRDALKTLPVSQQGMVQSVTSLPDDAAAESLTESETEDRPSSAGTEECSLDDEVNISIFNVTLNRTGLLDAELEASNRSGPKSLDSCIDQLESSKSSGLSSMNKSSSVESLKCGSETVNISVTSPREGAAGKLTFPDRNSFHSSNDQMESHPDVTLRHAPYARQESEPVFIGGSKSTAVPRKSFEKRNSEPAADPEFFHIKLNKVSDKYRSNIVFDNRSPGHSPTGAQPEHSSAIFDSAVKQPVEIGTSTEQNVNTKEAEKIHKTTFEVPLTKSVEKIKNKNKSDSSSQKTKKIDIIEKSSMEFIEKPTIDLIEKAASDIIEKPDDAEKMLDKQASIPDIVKSHTAVTHHRSSPAVMSSVKNVVLMGSQTPAASKSTPVKVTATKRELTYNSSLENPDVEILENEVKKRQHVITPSEKAQKMSELERVFKRRSLSHTLESTHGSDENVSDEKKITGDQVPALVDTLSSSSEVDSVENTKDSSSSTPITVNDSPVRDTAIGSPVTTSPLRYRSSFHSIMSSNSVVHKVPESRKISLPSTHIEKPVELSLASAVPDVEIIEDKAVNSSVPTSEGVENEQMQENKENIRSSVSPPAWKPKPSFTVTVKPPPPQPTAVPPVTHKQKEEVVNDMNNSDDSTPQWKRRLVQARKEKREQFQGRNSSTEIIIEHSLPPSRSRMSSRVLDMVNNLQKLQVT